MSEIDEFVGYRFGESNQLEVISRVGKRRDGKDKTYAVKCHECAKDPELFGEAVFVSAKSNITKGYIPCGCGGGPQWTPYQYEVRIKRLCKEMNYEFVSFVDDGGTVGVHTHMRLKCLTDGNVWDTGVVGNLLGKNHHGCPECKRRKRALLSLLPDSETLKSFNISKFPQGTTFTKSDERSGGHKGRYLWDVYCPICAEDLYALNGVGGSVFRAHPTILQIGQRPCRCSKVYRYTKEQTEVFIKDRLLKEADGNEFVEWIGEYKGGRKSKFIISCPIHGKSPVVLSTFKQAGMRCSKCRKVKNGKKGGFDIEKPSHIYILKVIGMTGDFVGYGISNDVSRRLAMHNKNLLEYGFVVEDFRTFACSGGEAHITEYLIKHTFERNPQEVEGFLTEATYLRHYDAVIRLVEDEKMKWSNYDGYEEVSGEMCEEVEYEAAPWRSLGKTGCGIGVRI